MMAMMLKVILRKSLGQNISSLVFGANQKDLDQSVLHVLAKTVITYVDVLGTWAKFWEPGKFQRT
jgi:hypothetical protein